MPADRGAAKAAGSFSEKGFYLSEFRGRTLAIAFRAPDAGHREHFERVLDELAGNATRVVLISGDAAALGSLPDTRLVRDSDARLEGSVWRALARSPRVGLVTGEGPAGPACRDVVRRLVLSKLVWLDPDGGLARADGERQSFVDLDALRELLKDGSADEHPRRLALLREVEALLAEGLPALNLCSAGGLAEELFTYAGSGTLFTRERYVHVRKLGLDDYDAADDLIARGVSEGYLAPRSPDEIERVLADAFGAFVEGRHLAGIGSLLVHAGAGVAEIASLYTLTRFTGEGIGGHLVGHAIEQAGVRGCRAVVACTTSSRVERFFERQGFRRVGPEALPEEKWRRYDPQRRASLRCLQRELD